MLPLSESNDVYYGMTCGPSSPSYLLGYVYNRKNVRKNLNYLKWLILAFSDAEVRAKGLDSGSTYWH